jgi:hypothetical protein
VQAAFDHLVKGEDDPFIVIGTTQLYRRRDLARPFSHLNRCGPDLIPLHDDLGLRCPAVTGSNVIYLDAQGMVMRAFKEQRL